MPRPLEDVVSPRSCVRLLDCLRPLTERTNTHTTVLLRLTPFAHVEQDLSLGYIFYFYIARWPHYIFVRLEIGKLKAHRVFVRICGQDHVAFSGNVKPLHAMCDFI